MELYMDENNKDRDDKNEKDRDFREEILEMLEEKTYQPLSDEEMVSKFQVWGRDAAALLNQLDELYLKGQIFRTKKGKYLLPRAMNMTTGILSKHRKGFGFVLPVNKEEEDVFIAPDNMKYAMNGDLVAVKLLTAEESGRRREGAVARIIRRASSEIVGTFQLQRRYGFVVSDDPKQRDDVFIAERNINGARSGDKVVAKITVWPEKDNSAEGVITEIISRSGDTGGDILALIRSRQLTPEFPQSVTAEAEAVPRQVEDGALVGRRDLRQKTIITIDGADSKDFDDAVSVERLENGNYLLGVHIADVTHYVREGSALDLEALKRGNSVYLIDQVIPMLPKALSNGICSLNPHEDRLTLSCDMEIDGRGQVVGHEIYESVIHSKERMVYTDVSDMLEARSLPETDVQETSREQKARRKDGRVKELRERYAAIWEDLLLMDELAKILRTARERRGSLDFDFDEAYITLNDEGIPTSVETAERRVANRLIEEFMLAANETVAEHFFWMDVPFVYRIHEKPSPEKMEELQKFLHSFGIHLKGNPENIHPRALNEIISAVEGKPEEHVVNTVMLRSMKKAFYGTECEGHFGLGVKYYCHFTSPIRRYPDLMIHRVIKEILSGEREGKAPAERRTAELRRKTEEAAAQSSATERAAQELERDVEKLKMAEYMSYHIGEVHDGIISGVANFGFFVELENTIEGMVRAADLRDDYYDYEPEKYRLIGRRRHRIYSLGQRVTIRVDSVDVTNREINFEVIS
ncbi:ribonuclease R [Bacilliculturomica massiliensis]|uniref:ribonuclease R n=1 Tax=Bacilliculturomica massiliensis TaxID=1917867 RepID=UPI001FE26FA5|nr:ribonuclease R [Bacilliculturomica massiliensis]